MVLVYVGAGLGILRKLDSDNAIIDEVSQITEPYALIPPVKGIKRAMMVGDQLAHYSLLLFSNTLISSE